MSEFNEAIDVSETNETTDECEVLDEDFESELDSKYEEYNNGERSLEDIQKEKEELMQMKEELMKYKESQESDATDDDDEPPEKVLKYTRR